MLYRQPILACHECDLLLRNVPIPVGKKLVCPRCGCMLYKPRRDPVNRCIALSLTTLILMLPAITLPVMTLNMLGLNAADTVLKGVVQLFGLGFWWMALLVLFCSVIAPFFESLIIVTLGVMVKLRQRNRTLIRLLKLQAQFRRWGMLEVYMIGILVAYIKMIDLGQIHIGVGMFCYIGMLLATLLNTLMFDSHSIWEMIGEQREQA